MSKKTSEIVIIGIGKFSKNLIQALHNTKIHIIAIDHDEKTIADIANVIDVAITGDATSEKFLTDNGIHKVEKIIIGVGTDIQTSLLTATTLIELGAKNIYAKANSDTHEKILRQIGIKNIIKPESVAARKLATQLLNPIFDANVTDFEVEIYDDTLSIARVTLVNKKYFDIEIMKLGLPLEKVNIILVSRKGKNILPYGSLKLKEGDRVNVLGSHEVVYEWANKLGVAKENKIVE